MRTRFFVALALAILPVSTVRMPLAIAAEQHLSAFPIAEMMRATALDEVFSQFVASIATSARTEQITTDEIFLDHWESTAARVFDAAGMQRHLERLLDGKFTPEEQDQLAAFFRSDFGRRMTALERASARLSPEAQLDAIDLGIQLAKTAGPIRTGQLDELMQLVSAEIAGAMVGQSMRAMLLGMSVSHQRGDIEVPWQEIDAQVSAMMPGLMADIANSQRALMAYAYRDLSDAELGEYLDFLRTDPARKFYAVAAYSIGRVVTQGMSTFGEALAARMQSVSI